MGEGWDFRWGREDPEASGFPAMAAIHLDHELRPSYPNLLELAENLPPEILHRILVEGFERLVGKLPVVT